MRKYRILLLVHKNLVPPDDISGLSEAQIDEFRTEQDILQTLRRPGHEIRVVGVGDHLTELRETIDEWHPHVVFNLLDEFSGIISYDHYVVAYLELIRQRYTGCNPRGMMLAQGKDLSKKLLKYHRLPVPAFQVFPWGRKTKRPGRLKFPLIVKSLTEDASLGISQASVVYNDEKLAERVAFIHDNFGTAAIAEEYIDGREIYVGVLGNERISVLPVWELTFADLAPGSLPIATEHVKHNLEYQRRRGVDHGPANGLTPQLESRIRTMVRRTCQILELDGYNRIDLRLSKDGVPYFIEANPNPEIAASEELASSALHDGIEYPELINRILALGIRRAGLDPNE